ncbi:MAG: hypothetical protein JWL62_3861 [Hyphomicrobiales bacterium]|nr:hypothetical protein [Hyphomicrobiales bacterium]
MATTANSNLCGRLVESDRVEGISVYDLQGTCCWDCSSKKIIYRGIASLLSNA